jgi:DNA-binding Xre family transcriptional regulator
MAYRNDLLLAKKAAARKTIQNLADETGLSTVTVNNILNQKGDHFAVKNLEKVATALGLSLNDLFSEKTVEAVV